MTVPSLSETAAAFDLRAVDYDDSRMHRHVADRAVVAADPQQGQLLLDLAGGTGLVARSAVARGAGAIVLDASPGMLQRAGVAEPRLLRVLADAHRIPMRDARVDLVTCVTALHLFAQPALALREAARVCRPGGRVVFTTWAADGWSVGRTLRRAAALEGVLVPDPKASTGVPAAAAALAASAGLQVDELDELRTTEPLIDRGAAWVAASRSARVTPGATSAAVHRRFLALLDDAVEHALLLLTCRPSQR